MKKKGFTLIELLVVISIIALLMAILMPALAKVRQIAQRVVCGTHLKGIGSAMSIYATEQEGKYPRAGRRYSIWGDHILNWRGGWPPNNSEDYAYGPIPASAAEGNPATISSCLYLLIKYSDVSPKQLLCGGDTSASLFNLSEYATGIVRNDDIMEAWDLGPPDYLPGTTIPATATHYSYSYQVPFGQIGLSFFPLTSLSDSGMAVMADKNPYIVIDPDPAWDDMEPMIGYRWKGPRLGGTKQTERWGNTPNHLMEGQNVLFNDGHVTFHDVPYCGIDNDNIYSKFAVDLEPEVGLEPWDPPYGPVLPQSKIDSLLINEGAQCRSSDAIFKNPP